MPDETVVTVSMLKYRCVFVSILFLSVSSCFVMNWIVALLNRFALRVLVIVANTCVSTLKQPAKEDYDYNLAR